MKQNEYREREKIDVHCFLSFKERMKVLFSKGFIINIDLSTNTDVNPLTSYSKVSTINK